MKNILFIHSSSELYGSDRSLLNILKNIDKKKFRVHVILPCQGPLVDEIKNIPDIDLEIFEVAVLRRKNLSLTGALSYVKDFFKSYSYLKKYINENNIDIVDTNTAVVFPGAIAAKHTKKKSVWHIREIIKSKLENKVISFIMNKYADLVIANSKSTAEALQVNQHKVRIIYNAVDEKITASSVIHDNFTIGMAGRINRWKGQKLFVDVAEIVIEKYPNIVFEIAGEAYYGEEYLKKELEEYIEKKNLKDNIKLLGQINDMDSFYSHLDIFILPSIQPEPFGLVVIEAMEYGIPVVATNHGGPTEIIKDGIDGYLVSYDNSIEMATRIIELITDENKRTTFGERGKKKKRKLFSISTMVRNIESVFEELL